MVTERERERAPVRTRLYGAVAAAVEVDGIYGGGRRLLGIDEQLPKELISS